MRELSVKTGSDKLKVLVNDESATLPYSFLLLALSRRANSQIPISEHPISFTSTFIILLMGIICIFCFMYIRNKFSLILDTGSARRFARYRKARQKSQPKDPPGNNFRHVSEFLIFLVAGKNVPHGTLIKFFGFRRWEFQHEITVRTRWILLLRTGDAYRNVSNK